MTTAWVPLTGVREIVAVHSAKGGVGKSTVAVNLAVACARMDMRVALLDADIHGPSVAHMMGSSERPRTAPSGDRVFPIERHGVKYLSLANVAEPDAPVIWRGPMVAGALRQLLEIVDWGETDMLLVDMPPGTGDAVLGIGQAVTLSGVVVVTTPEALSVSDTRRGVHAFERLEVPVLGLVENMASFVCDACGDEVALFGEGGGRRAAEALGIPFLGRVPIDPLVVPAGDSGVPILAKDAGQPAARAFDAVAKAMLARMALSGQSSSFDIEWKRMKAKERRRDPPGKVKPSGEPGRPDALWQAADDVLGIRWGDGRTTFHGAYALRVACPCAGCVEEWSGKRQPSLDTVPRGVRPVTIRSVGRYAILPVWSDGHRTGMFSFRALREGAGAVDAPA
ncbi:MAG: P-loop NTPase [Candidatus Eiseniibacteriota bacterium]